MAKKSSIINVAVLGDAKKLKKTLDGAEKRVGTFSNSVGKSMKFAGAAIGALGVAGAAAVLKLGSEFEKVERTLRVGTGATGDALEALVQSTRNLAKRVPADFEAISNAVADINTRLGLTGTELEDFSEQMLNLSRITGSDLQGNISSVTRVLGDWGDMAGTAAGAADFLFSVAQATGIEFASLSDQLVNYGAPMRQIGFDFEQSALLIGKFEKEGVNAELVLGSLRQALGKMARQGEPAIETFQRTTEAIKNAGTASEANMLALELFGARAGPDMAAAIREGRFELDDYFNLMEGGGDRINVAAQSTETFGEKLTVLKNRIVVGVAPMVERAFDAITKAFDDIRPHAEHLIEQFQEMVKSEKFREFSAEVRRSLNQLRDAFHLVVKWIKDNNKWLTVLVGSVGALMVAAKAYSAIVAIQTALTIAATAAQSALNVAMMLNPIGLVVAAIVALVAILALAYLKFDSVRDIVDKVWDEFRGLSDFFNRYVKPIISAAIESIMVVLRSWWDVIKDVAGLIQALFRGDMADVWKHFKDLVVNTVGLIIDQFIKLPMNILNASKPLLGKFALIVSDFAVYLVGKIINLVAAIPGEIVELLAAVGKDLLQAGKNLGGWLLDGFISAIKGAASAVGDAFKNLIPDWVPGWMNPFDGGDKKTSNRRTSSLRQTTTAAAQGFPTTAAAQSFPTALPGSSSAMHVAGMAEEIGNRAGKWAETTRTRPGGSIAKGMQWIPDVGNLPDQLVQGASYNTGSGSVVVNVAGSVTTEAELVENIRQGLLKSQQSGKQLVL